MNVQGLKLKQTKTSGLADEWDVTLGETVIGGITETEDSIKVRVWGMSTSLRDRTFSSKAEAVEAILQHIISLALTTDHVIVQVSAKRFVVAEANDRGRKKFKVRTKPIPTQAQAEEVRKDLDDNGPQDWGEYTNSVYIEEPSVI